MESNGKYRRGTCGDSGVNVNVEHPWKLHVDHILEMHGGFYTFDDIVAAVQRGDMQSFNCNESWAVVQVIDFPRKRVVDVVFVVGKMEDMELLESEVIGWAREIGAVMLMTGARNGWRDRAQVRGWKTVSSIFMKDLTDGS